MTNTKQLLKLTVEPVFPKYYSEDTSFGIYVCKIVDEEVNSEDFFDKLDSEEEITITGSMPKLTIGRQYNITCEETHHKVYGKQYLIKSIFSPEPNSQEEEQGFLSTLVTEMQYNNIVSVYPSPITAITSGEFDISLVKGIGEKTFENIKAKVEENHHLMKALSVLGRFGISYNFIRKIVETYSNADVAIEKIMNDPYILYKDIEGIGFIKADNIAKSIGIDYKDPKRIKAAIMYSLEENENMGNTWMYVEDIIPSVEKLLDFEIENFETYIENDRYFYLENNIIALSKTRKCEEDIVSELFRIRDAETKPLFHEDRLDEIVKDIQENLGIEYTDQQRELFYKLNSSNVVILTGFAGSGKCVHGDTYIYTNKGMIKIKDIPEYFTVIDSNCNSRVVSYNLNAEKNNLNTSKWYNMGESDTIKIKTKQGYFIEGTPEHPIIIMDTDGNLKFKQLKFIKDSDIIAISKNNDLWGNSFIDLDIAYLMGFLTGDGSLNSINNYKYNYTIGYSKSDNKMAEYVNDILKKKFGIKNIRRYESGNSVDYFFFNKDTHNYLNGLGLSFTTAAFKKVPQKILMSKKECVVSFLQGLFDTDGTVDARGTFEWCTASKELAEQVHLLLLNLGIVSHLTSRKVKNYEHNDYYRIFIYSDYLRKYKQEIGFKLCQHKKERLEKAINSYINPNIDVLYYQNDNIKNHIHKKLLGKEYYRKDNHYRILCNDGVNRRMIHVFDNRNRNCSSYLINNIIESIDIRNEVIDYLYNISSNMFLDKIDSIESGKTIVYDFTVPETHSFVSNGIISHNTSTLNGCLDMVDKSLLSYTLVSPTARAAKVIEKATGRQASTIHRALKYNPQKGFMYNKSNPLCTELVVADESSMIDIYLFRSLLNAIESGSRLLLVGDSAQLESVATGNVLGDIISSGQFPTIQLDKVFRQALDSGVLSVATDVRQGVKFFSNTDDYIEIGLDKSFKAWFGVKEQTAKRTIMIFKECIKKYPIEDIMVISPMNKGGSGVKILNELLQEVYNPYSFEKNQIQLKRNTFREGDKVMHIKNYYDAEWLDKDFFPLDGTGIFNGDMGTIVKINTNQNLIYVDYGEKIIEYHKGMFDMLQLGYAISTHKAQGGGFPIVIMVMDTSHYMMLKRNLLYTAITRSSEKLYLIGDKKAIGIAINNNSLEKKRTFLEDLLKKQL